jgi:hypothetical protein
VAKATHIMTREEKRLRAVANAQKKADELAAYLANPKLCRNCKVQIDFKKRNTNEYCSSRCSSAVNSSLRSTRIKANKKSFECINCGTLKVYKSEKPGRYCSNTCQHQYQEKQQFALVEAGKASNSGQVKRYLLAKYGNICMDSECCWNQSKRPVVVELEHQDGNSDNNTLENCILLCPNCHSLTPTYKNKNMGNGRAYRRARYAEGKSY